MKNTKIIEEKVSTLSEKQKDNVLKAGRNGVIIMIFTSLLSIVAMAIVGISFLKMPDAYLHFNKLVIKIVTIVVINIVLCLGEYALIKKKYPYYSDKVYSYIKKSRKSK